MRNSAYRMRFAPEGTLAERVEETASHYSDQHQVTQIVEFIRAAFDRPICQPKNDKE